MFFPTRIKGDQVYTVMSSSKWTRFASDHPTLINCYFIDWTYKISIKVFLKIITAIKRFGNNYPFLFPFFGRNKWCSCSSGKILLNNFNDLPITAQPDPSAIFNESDNTSLG